MPANANPARVLVEVAVDSLAGARAAAAAGADRIELCSSLGEGGLTPSAGLLAAVRGQVALPVFAMVRPRPGDFRYDEPEFATMCADVRAAAAAGVDGIVCGALTADGQIDAPRMRELVALAAPLPVTCHRAFDLVADPDRALDDLIALGVRRVLTSGQHADALAGAAAIARAVQRAAGRIVIMAGAGLREHNVRQVVAATGVGEVHVGAARRTPSAMVFRRPGVPMGSSPAGEFEVRTTDAAMVAAVVAAVGGLGGTLSRS